MLFRNLDKLRSKPAHVRSRVAFVTAGAFTLAVGAVWISSLPALFEDIRQQAATGDSGFFEQTAEQFSDAADETKEELNEVKEAVIDTSNLYMQATSSQVEYVQIATSTGAR